MRPTAELLLGLASVVAARLPPGKPLTKDELAALGPPLELVLWKYQSAMAPEYQLATAVAGVALGRYLEWRMAQPVLAPMPTPEAPAA